MKDAIKCLFGKINIVCFLVAFIHWGISFFTDQFIFLYNEIEIGKLLFYKSIFLILLFFLWQLVGVVIKEYKNNLVVRSFIKHSLIYFCIVILFLLLTWPGMWRYDELNVLFDAIKMQDYKWHWFMMSNFYIFALMLIPVPCGIIIIQNLIISLIFGYTFVKVEQNLCSTKLKYILFIPFVLIPVLACNLYAYNTTLYAYFVLLLSIKIIFWDYEKIIKTRDLFLVLFLLLVISLTRLEGVVFLFLVPIMLLFIFRGKIKKKYKLIILITTILFLGIFFLLKNSYEKQLHKSYELCQMFFSISEIYSDLEPDLKTKMLSEIEQFAPMNIVSEGDVDNDIAGKIAGDINKYREFKNFYLNIILKNPKSFLRTRYRMFVESTHFFCPASFLYRYIKFGEFIRNTNFLMPINMKIRTMFVDLLEKENVLYSMRLSVILIFLTFIISIILKKISLSFLILIFFVHTLIVFFMAPISCYVYYFYLSLCSYVFFTLVILRPVNLIKKKKI